MVISLIRSASFFFHSQRTAIAAGSDLLLFESFADLDVSEFVSNPTCLYAAVLEVLLLLDGSSDSCEFEAILTIVCMT